MGAQEILPPLSFLALGHIATQALARRPDRLLEPLVEIVVDVRHQVGPGVLLRGDTRGERLTVGGAPQGLGTLAQVEL